jgi:hypothetical protein
MNRAGYKCILYETSKKLLSIGTPHVEIVNASQQAVELVDNYIKKDTATNAKHITMGVSLGVSHPLAQQVCRGSDVER